MENKNKGNKTQGVELPKEKKSTSPSYTIRQFKQVTEKLKELNFINEEDYKEIKNIQEKVIRRFIGYELYGEENNA